MFSRKLEEAIKEAQEVRFRPDREKDKLSKALGNFEHPGRTRGTSDSIPWVHGFPDSTSYRSRERNKKEKASKMQKINERLAKLEALESQRATGPPSQQHEDPSLDTAHDATPPSQQRSSVASTELVQPGTTAPCYPVDGITDNEHCVLMAKCHNLTLKVVVGYVFPPQPDATLHFAPAPTRFPIVGVDKIMDGFEGLELEYL